MNFLKLNKNINLLIKIILLGIIGLCFYFIKSLYISLIGIVIIIISIILLYLLILKIIDEKEIKKKKIIYISLSILFSLFFLKQFTSDIKYLSERIQEVKIFDQYVVSKIEEIKKDSIIAKAIVNKKEKIYEISSSNSELYKEGEDIIIYINSNNINKFTTISPTFSNMFYFTLFFFVSTINFILLYVPINKSYRLFKPKKIEKEIKIKK